MPSFNPPAVWEADPHTLAKIEIMRGYLRLWFTILGPSFKHLAYIDGFAGPGRYSNSTEGSPVAALEAAMAAIAAKKELESVQFSFLFVEKREDFVESLRSVISAINHPPNIKISIEQGLFADKAHQYLSRPGADKIPAFAFVDPFGATGVPFNIIGNLLSRRSCELLLNLDSDGIARVLAAQDSQKNQENLTSLFGDDSWRNLNRGLSQSALSAQILDLYKTKLRALPNVKYVFTFTMNSRNGKLNYHLLFASQHHLGLEKMKEAMKAVDKTGAYSFCDDVAGQETMPFDFSNPSLWAEKLQSRFAGKWLPYADFRDYTLNETPFTNPKEIFKLLKAKEKIQVLWKGPSPKQGYPEEKIRSILILK
jgi:three-Cys-motif partner protein